MEISKVVAADLQAIVALQNTLLLDEYGANAGKGFLVSRFTTEDYGRFAGEYEYFFKATENGRIVGVLMAYESSAISPGDTTNSLLKYVLKKQFVLIKQIFVSPDMSNKGVATMLYKHLFSVIPDDRPAIAVVVMEPFNKISCEFHKRRGFSEFLTFTPDADRDGKTRKRSAWIRPARDDANFYDDLRLMNVHDGMDDVGQTMSTRVSNLVDLYQHEDNLNWTKIGLQCTILFALVAALAYFYDKELQKELYPLLLLVGAGGVMINVMFLMKIRSGLEYMSTYKKKIRDYDRILAFFYPKVSVIFDDGAFISRRSITSRLLLVLSWTGIVLWTLSTIWMLMKNLLSCF